MDIETQKQKLEEVLKKVTGFMNLDCRVEFREEIDDKDALFVSVYTPENAKFLIGKNGQVLKAIEQVARLILAKSEQSLNIILDVNDYRKSRATFLIDLAKQAVNRVRNSQKAEALIPMTPYERRIVHMELAACPDVATESIGEEPHRRIVIKPYP